MRNLWDGYCFEKVDAYNEIKLVLENQERLALNTNRVVMLQMRLPFGIESAPAYFQEIKEQLNRDLSEVTVYMDDILVMGNNTQEHFGQSQGIVQMSQWEGSTL